MNPPRLAGHPMHATVVVFPIVLFAATVGLLLAYVGNRDPFYYRAALVACSAGVTTGLLAMLPRALDLVSRPASRERTTAARHAGGAMLAIGIFALAAGLLYRSWSSGLTGELVDATLPLAVASAGVVAMTIVGVLGWVHRAVTMPVKVARPVARPALLPRPAAHTLS